MLVKLSLTRLPVSGPIRSCTYENGPNQCEILAQQHEPSYCRSAKLFAYRGSASKKRAGTNCPNAPICVGAHVCTAQLEPMLSVVTPFACGSMTTVPTLSAAAGCFLLVAISSRGRAGGTRVPTIGVESAGSAPNVRAVGRSGIPRDILPYAKDGSTVQSPAEILSISDALSRAGVFLVALSLSPESIRSHSAPNRSA
ncbi:hypothetical protein BDV95DRAFT_304775 [Massariosphaeria phaeospora]|uniref:Uncharacterized protein n=1 Tax=Massariosphaeria phaeospora TaxID=100035 RepID=A0A7C8MEI3_9PLEO|nr:hypothetical protein BDV95DRAFT_304775 [Massariosphaeria phaeospora]